MGTRATEADEAGPERTCIVTRRKASPDDLIRFVLGPDAEVVPDLRRKLPGRGVWVTAKATVVAEAMRKRAFSRGFKAEVKSDPRLDVVVDDLLARDALQSLSMANKAGAVTAGFAKVEKAIAAGGVAALLHAADGAEDGIRKLDAVLRRHWTREGAPNSINVFTAQQLELALGRTNVIHAALAEGPAGHALLSRCRRLIVYRSAAAQDLEADAKSASG